MKLSRLFLLIPAFMMMGCKNHNFQPSGNPSSQEESSEPEKNTVVTEEEFNAIFQQQKLFLEDNVVVKTVFSTGERDFFVEAENCDVKYYKTGDADEDVTYLDFDLPKDFAVIKCEDGTWYAKEYHQMSEFKEFLFDRACFVPFLFSDFIYNENHQAYGAQQIYMEVGENKVYFKNIEIKFEDKKPTSITCSYYPKEHPENEEGMEQTYTYGNAHVDNPK